MRRTALACAAVMLSACAGGTEKKAESKESAAKAQSFKVDAATAASVSGRALYTGPKVTPRKIDMAGEEAECARLHKSPVTSEEVVVNPGGTLANVFVYVSKGLEGKSFEPPVAGAEFDQTGCMFRPHVIGVRTGQPFVISNADPVTHNVHPMPQLNREWNQGQPPGADKIERTFTQAEIGIPVKCNVHSWMRAWIHVVDHPYFSVSGAQGSYDLKNLPPGSYTLTAWHEKFGTKEQTVTLAAASSQVVDFSFGGK